MSELPPAQRREARFALAALPVGVVVLATAVLGFLAVLVLAVVAPFSGPGWLWIEGWCLVALVLAARNAFAGIAITAAFDWRPVPLAVGSSAAIVAAFPGWWLP